MVAEALVLETNSRLQHRSPVLKTRFFFHNPHVSPTSALELSLRYIVPYHISYQMQGVLNSEAQKLDLYMHWIYFRDKDSVLRYKSTNKNI